MSWVTTRLGDFAPLVYGKSLPKRERATGGEVHVFGSGGVVGKHDEALTTGPTIVVGRKGTVGKVYFSPAPCWPIDTTYFVEYEDSLLARYAYYALQSIGLDKLNYDSTVPGLNRDHAHSIKLRVPSTERQHRIATVLGTFDDLIENNRRRIEILEEMARLLYREWFVHFRYSEHENVELVDSDLGPIPNGWKVTQLSEVCSLVMGQSPKSEYYNDVGDGIPFHQGVTDFGSRYPRHTKWTGVNKRVAEAGDILFSVRAPVGRINLAPDRLVVGRGLSAIRAKDGNQNFLLAQLQDKFAEEDLIGGGTIFNAVTKHDMESILLLEPDRSVVRNFEAKIATTSDLIANLWTQNCVLSEARDLLLPRLISGELDVSELDLDMATV